VLATARGEDCREEEDPSFDLWSLETGALLKSPPTTRGCPRFEWTKEGLQVAANPDTGVSHIILFDEKLAPKLELDHYLATFLRFDPAGKHAATASGMGLIALFDLDHPDRRVDRPEKDAHVGGDTNVDVEFTRDGRSLLVLDDSAGLDLLSIDTLKSRLPRRASKSVLSATPSPDGSLVAGFANGSGNLELYRTKDLSLVRSMGQGLGVGAGPGIHWIDGAHLLVTTVDAGVELFGVDGVGSKIVEGTPASPRCYTSLSGVGDRFAIVGPDCAITFRRGPTAESRWSVPAGAVTDPSASEPGSSSWPNPWVAWSPRGDLVAVVTPSGRAAIHDADTGKEIASTDLGAVGEILAADFTPDGRALAVASGSLTLLRVADGARIDLTEFQPDTGRVLVALGDGGRFAGPRDLVACAELAANHPVRGGGVETRDLVGAFFEPRAR
jgi:WD40 repeat protein